MREATPSSFSSVLGDKNAAYPEAIADLKAAGKLSESVEPRQIKYLNNLVEQDHRFIKRLVKPGMGFFSVGSACMTLQGYERMNMIRKGQMDGPRFLCGTRKPIQTITTEEFERLLLACAPPNEIGTFADRAAVRNRAILWLLYDTGIRASELINLHVGDFDHKHVVVTVLGKGSKERRVALGQNCLCNLSYYLDKHRPDEEELAEWGSGGEDHLFLSETREPLTKNGMEPLTKNGMEMLFKRLRTRAGIVGKRISPHILRHTFAMNYLIKSNDPFSLQELLGHEDLTTVLNYIHMNDAILQEQKRKYSPAIAFRPACLGHARQGAKTNPGRSGGVRGKLREVGRDPVRGNRAGPYSRYDQGHDPPGAWYSTGHATLKPPQTQGEEVDSVLLVFEFPPRDSDGTTTYNGSSATCNGV